MQVSKFIFLIVCVGTCFTRSHAAEGKWKVKENLHQKEEEQEAHQWDFLKKKLFNAIKYNDVDYVNVLLEEYEELMFASCNVKLDSIISPKLGMMPLQYAAFLGRVRIVKILLDKGAFRTWNREIGPKPLEWNEQNRSKPFGKTALHYACQIVSPMPTLQSEYVRRTVIIRELVEHGADVNVRDQHGQTPLHYAASGNHIPLMKALLQNDNIDVDVQDEQGWTPLFTAVAHGNITCAKLLLDYLADIRILATDGESVIARADRCIYDTTFFNELSANWDARFS